MIDFGKLCYLRISRLPIEDRGCYIVENERCMFVGVLRFVMSTPIIEIYAYYMLQITFGLLTSPISEWQASVQ